MEASQSGGLARGSNRKRSLLHSQLPCLKSFTSLTSARTLAHSYLEMAAPGGPSEVMARLMEAERAVCQRLTNVEAKIFRFEEDYLSNSSTIGNVVVGYEGSTQEKRGDNAIFSGSSATFTLPEGAAAAGVGGGSKKGGAVVDLAYGDEEERQKRKR